ncbi:MAG: aldose epimerase family protein [Bacteroidota bacterium]|nr:aldose epimerase family protein [Ferruginibacter sp.]
MNKPSSLVGIEQSKWGSVNDQDVCLFTLQNKKGTRLTVTNYGATAQSLFTADKHGILADILLGYPNLADYQEDDFYMGCVVGRYANRIAGGRVVIDGKEHQLATRSGGYHQHGGVQGFNKKVFGYAIFEAETSRGIHFTYTSQHLEEGFPGTLTLQVTYTLDDADNWIIEYRASTDQATLVNLTQHAYFNLSGQPGQLIDGHELKINSNYYLPVNAMQVPTGKLASVANTPFNFSSFKKIGKDLATDHEQLRLSRGYDHSFVLKKASSPALVHAAVLREKKSGRELNVYTTEPAVHLYTGNFLDNLAGKNQQRYPQRAGLCLETQHFPDAPNQPDFPATTLRPGEEFYSKTIFKFSVTS